MNLNLPHQDTYNLNMAENHLEDKFIKHLLYVFFEQIHLLAPLLIATQPTQATAKL